MIFSFCLTLERNGLYVALYSDCSVESILFQIQILSLLLSPRTRACSYDEDH